jgi:hypothetical protein
MEEMFPVIAGSHLKGYKILQQQLQDITAATTKNYSR